MNTMLMMNRRILEKLGRQPKLLVILVRDYTVFSSSTGQVGQSMLATFFLCVISASTS